MAKESAEDPTDRRVTCKKCDRKLKKRQIEWKIDFCGEECILEYMFDKDR